MHIQAVAELRISHRNCDELMIQFILILHDHETNYSGRDKSQGINRFGSKNKNIKGIAIISQSLGNEPIVSGVINGGIKNAIELEQAGLLIQFLLVGATHWNLNNTIHNTCICFRTRGHIVPDIGATLFVWGWNLGHVVFILIHFGILGFVWGNLK